MLEGALVHEDNMGNGSTIVPGDVQCMSAGSGVLHSEYNRAAEQITRFLQIWIRPNVSGIAPRYQQKRFAAASKRGRLRLLASPDGHAGSLSIRQDARVYAALIDGSEHVTHVIVPGRRAYVHVARGSVTANGVRLSAGDALKAMETSAIAFTGGVKAEVLLFDLA